MSGTNSSTAHEFHNNNNGVRMKLNQMHVTRSTQIWDDRVRNSELNSRPSQTKNRRRSTATKKNKSQIEYTGDNLNEKKIEEVSKKNNDSTMNWKEERKSG